MKEADVVELRRHGLSDGQILAVVLIAAFFNVATRVADALGVELERELTRGTQEYEHFMQGRT
jgi:alkylhydroperoxidase family enzyme